MVMAPTPGNCICTSTHEGVARPTMWNTMATSARDRPTMLRGDSLCDILEGIKARSMVHTGLCILCLFSFVDSSEPAVYIILVSCRFGVLQVSGYFCVCVCKDW